MLQQRHWRKLLENQLAEDRADDDVTVSLLGTAAEQPVLAKILAKEKGVFAGRGWIEVLSSFGCTVDQCLEDGERFAAGSEVARFRGALGNCLSLERSVLNTLTHLCGVATKTRAYADAVKPTRTEILATRKTLPALRAFQLHAVQCGGGKVHRRSLSDGILIKENHQQWVPLSQLLETAFARRSPLHGIEIEVQSLSVLDSLSKFPDVVMLDNLSDDEIAAAMERLRGKCRVEASGGMTLERVARVAALGVDYISVGALTHSSVSIDLSLDLEEIQG
jgi:nicotinate-nucleotide pyrophosphorylase (carboxylating)